MTIAESQFLPDDDPRGHTLHGVAPIRPASRPIRILPDLDTCTEEDLLNLAANARRVPDDMYALTGSQSHLDRIFEILEDRDSDLAIALEEIESLKRQLAVAQREAHVYCKAYDKEQQSSTALVRQLSDAAQDNATMHARLADAQSLAHAALRSEIAARTCQMQLYQAYATALADSPVTRGANQENETVVVDVGGAR